MDATIQHVEDLKPLANQVLVHFPHARVFTFNAPMGAGKTTFIKEIATALGVQENMSSPTYAIVNQYQTDIGDVVYHMDLYRLENIDEALEIGIEEYLYSGQYVFIEWPAIINKLLPTEYINITIEVTGPSSRRLIIQQNG